MSGKSIQMIILSLLLAAACAAQTTPSGQAEGLPRKIDALFAEWNRPDSPGCALAVIKDGHIIHKRGYGIADLEHDVPITPRTVFYIGSTSKQFVTMCILLLEEQGLLTLDDKVRKWIPAFPEYEHPVTIRHLIHHTSGIRDYLTLWALTGRDYLDYIPDEAVMDIICRQKELNFLPGERYLYSNSCYFLLSEIVKEVSGQTLREFAHQHIFVPLSLKRSHFGDNVNDIIKDRAFGYAVREGGTFNNLIMRFDLVGSGGLYTCVEDLALWDANFYDNRLGRRDPELIRMMHENGRLNDGTELHYAFAIQNGSYRGLRTVDHGGALGGYRAQLLRFPDQRCSVVILSNLADFNPSRMAFRVADIVLADVLDPVPEKAESETAGDRSADAAEEESNPPSEIELRSFEGTYYSEELRCEYWIRFTNEGLTVTVGYNPPEPMEWRGADRFDTGRIEMTFQRDTKGIPSGFSVDAGRVRHLKFIRREGP